MKKILIAVGILLTLATGYMYFQTYQNAYSQVGSMISEASKGNDVSEINELLDEAKANAHKIGINDAEFFSQIQTAINATGQNIDLAKMAVSQIDDPTNAYIWSKYWWLFVTIAAFWAITISN